MTKAPCTGTYTAYNNRAIILSARSWHVGGAHVTLADGAVRFISENINLGTWQALGTHSGNETLGEF